MSNMDNTTIVKYTDKKDLIQIRSGLRQAFIRSRYKNHFLKLNRVEIPRYKKCGELAKRPWVKYKCVECDGLFKVDDINVDHIKKVGSFEDIMDIGGFFFRIWCDYSNLQILCKDCHKTKTKKERQLDAWIKGIKKTLDNNTCKKD